MTNNDEVYRSLFHNIQSGIAYCKMLFQDGRPIDFVYLMVNDTFTGQSGMKDVVGKKISEVIPCIHETDPQVLERYARVVLSGEPERFEVHVESLKQWFSVFVYSPKPEHFIAIFDNITERKVAQSGLVEKELLLQQFIECAPAAIAMFDKEMRYLAVSKRFIQDYHLPNTNLIGRSHYEVFPEIPERWREFHRRGLAGETIRCNEDLFIRANGEKEWHRWEITPWFSGNELGGILLFTESITELKEAEEQKTRLADKLQLALDAARMGFWHYDPVAQVISFDQRHQEILGLPSKLQTKEEILQHIHPDDRACVWEKVAAALNPVDPKPYEAEYRYFMPDGSVRWLKANAMATFEGEGQARHATCLVGTVTDITEHKQADVERAWLSAQRQLALDAANMGWWCYDLETDKVTYDERYGQICGFSGKTINAEAILARTYPDDREKLQERVNAALNPNDPKLYEVEVRIVLDDGSIRWIQSNGIVAFEGEGQSRHAMRMVGTVVDITSSKKSQEGLLLAATVYRDSSEAMIVLDENHNILMVNQAFVHMTGYDANEVIGQHPSFLRAGQQEATFYDDKWQQVHDVGHFKGETWQKTKNGQFYAVQITINTISGEDGLPPRYVMLLSDITEKKRSDDVIWNQANFDTLTGLPNRRFFRDRLEHEVRNAKRNNQTLALLFIDLDGFKDVNDTLGHDMGDLLLKEAADRLYRCVRESDTVARLGGDEFTVILTELHDPGNADHVAQNILQALSEPITLGKEQAYVSASVGITLYPNDAAEVEELVKNADQAMYEAKQRGKNQYQYFTPAMQQAAVKRMHLVNDLRKALDRNQFEILYQPIVELSTGAIRKAEALIRWRHPTRGMINPVEFISAAEDTGMIAAFGNWVFHEAARQAVVWRDKYHSDFQISVNISPMQFRKEGIDPAVWLEHLKGLDLPGQGIVVEITEGLLLDVNLKVSEQLLMLRDAGIEVALDDFGTGYSSLAYLKRFDIDYLKIDQAFVQNLTADSDDMALCEAIIVMAHKLGLKVIAEGVETDAQRALLASAGCDFAQGYFYSKPVPVDEFQRLVESDPY